MQFFALYSSKNEVSETYFDIVTTHNDRPSYVKHFLGSVYVFFTLFGDCGGGGVGNEVVHNLLFLCLFFALCSSKIKVFETYFFDTVIT